jgi:hypothetical protein
LTNRNIRHTIGYPRRIINQDTQNEEHYICRRPAILPRKTKSRQTLFWKKTESRTTEVATKSWEDDELVKPKPNMFVYIKYLIKATANW